MGDARPTTRFVDQVMTLCQGVNESTIVASDVVSASVQLPTTLTINMTAVWTIATNKSALYTTCVQTSCTPPSPLHGLVLMQAINVSASGTYNISLHLMLNAALQCTSSASVDIPTVVPSTNPPISQGGDRSRYTLELVVFGCLVAAFVVLAPICWRRRKERRAKTQLQLTSVDTPVELLSTTTLVPPPQEPTTWFETVYHNDAALPASILHDDPCTRTILRHSMPSDRALSLRSVLFEIDSASNSNVVPPSSSASSTAAPWHDHAGEWSPADSYDSSAVSRFDAYETSDVEED
ncbi:Aste57867_13141 [Aphanomyces stellatus]|uniref:Aste57867_13141 protein n=1 Tax=Aphanomyces stellatus TaxID=120398 RepID=A0A485KY22_9STRA|nr:hypothetical protein As57867_013092 [Aphanomyces stellatus]VFT89983.1 Aste57867_13141 [Aphanomyces stellatus]